MLEKRAADGVAVRDAPFPVTVTNLTYDRRGGIRNLTVQQGVAERAAREYVVRPRYFENYDYLRALHTNAAVCLADVLFTYGLPHRIYRPHDGRLYVVYDHHGAFVWLEAYYEAAPVTVLAALISTHEVSSRMSSLRSTTQPDVLDPVRWSDVEGYFRQPCEVD